jgi:hypothetical protein
MRALFSILSYPTNRHRAIGFTPEQLHNAFANTLSREESDQAYERYYVPPRAGWCGRVLWPTSRLATRIPT